MLNPLGGFARRASYLSKFKKTFSRTPFLLVDAGNFSADISDDSRPRNRWVLEGMLRMGYAALNVGELEVIPETERWSSLEKTSLPLVSANALKSPGGEPARPAYLLREVDGPAGRRPIRVGLLGLTKPPREALSLFFSDPIEAARRSVAELRPKCDLLVVLAGMEVPDAKALLTAVPGVDVLVGAAGEVRLPSPVQQGGALICYPGDRGMVLGELRLFFSQSGQPARYFHRLVPLSAAINDEPSFVDFQKRAEAEISRASRPH